MSDATLYAVYQDQVWSALRNARRRLDPQTYEQFLRWAAAAVAQETAAQLDEAWEREA